MKTFESSTEYKPVIGFEIHIQLATKSKMFSPAANDPDEKAPNKNIDEIVTGQPGTLPVANKEAIRLSAMVGVALNCQIDEWSKLKLKIPSRPSDSLMILSWIAIASAISG